MLSTHNARIKSIALAFAALIAAGANAQQNDTLVKFLDAKFEPTTLKKMVYKGQVYKQQERYAMVVTLPSGTPVYTAQFKDAKTSVLHGDYVRYYSNGSKQSMATFVNGKTEGPWIWWYENGQVMDSGMARNGIKDGTWYNWYPNGQMKIQLTYAPAKEAEGVMTTAAANYAAVFHGPYKSWYENGMQESEGNFANNKRVGSWRWFHQNGKVSTIEEYNEAGKVTAMQCFDTTGASQGDYCSLNRPAFIKGHGDFRTYMTENFRWPKAVSAQKKKGSVSISFIVSTDGRMTDVNVRGTTKLLEDAVKYFLYQIPLWEPAISHNRIVAFEENIEVIYEGKPKFTMERQEFPEMWRPDYIREAMWE
ncbi:energy transducer TonB [Pseudocnuella soli]|uniref:energy transducer TonB n=1 Tax=Pseudocnuella soli TaxID=2502779 RepID=UPI001051F626|nr:energy transducer TonB [Pseudocnuella soli]